MNTHREYVMNKKFPEKFLPIDYSIMRGELNKRVTNYLMENNIPLCGTWSDRYKSHIIYEEEFDYIIDNVMDELISEGYPKSFERLYIKSYDRYNMTKDQMIQEIEKIKETLLPKFVEEIKRDYKKYYTNDGKIKYISKQSEHQLLLREIDEYNNKSSIEKIVLNHCDGRTAPTLTTGWIVFIFLLFIEAFFFGRIAAWILTTIMFIIWRKKEIDNYN